jgi:hypothetical protein
LFPNAIHFFTKHQSTINLREKDLGQLRFWSQAFQELWVLNVPIIPADGTVLLNSFDET